MQEELQRLYNRVVILEPKTSKQGAYVRDLYNLSTSQSLSHVSDDLDKGVSARHKAELSLETECNVIFIDYRSKIDPLRQKYEFIDQIASKENSFSTAYRKYIFTPILTKDKFMIEFGTPLSECYKVFEKEDLDVDSLYRNAQMINDDFKAIGLVGLSFIAVPINPIPFILSLVLIGKKTINLIWYDQESVNNINKLSKQDRKMQALYDLA